MITLQLHVHNYVYYNVCVGVYIYMCVYNTYTFIYCTSYRCIDHQMTDCGNSGPICLHFFTTRLQLTITCLLSLPSSLPVSVTAPPPLSFCLSLCTSVSTPLCRVGHRRIQFPRPAYLRTWHLFLRSERLLKGDLRRTLGQGCRITESLDHGQRSSLPFMRSCLLFTNSYPRQKPTKRHKKIIGKETQLKRIKRTLPSSLPS